MVELNAYQKEIENLISEGYTILQVFNDDGSAFYFVVHKFEESYSSSAQSVDFCQLVGINVTDFLAINSRMPSRHELIAKFKQYINDAMIIRCQFSKNVRWFKWTQA